VELLYFMVDNAPLIIALSAQHLIMVLSAVALAIVTGVAVGIVISLYPAASRIVLALASIVMTIPSVALFGLLIAPLSLIGQGIGMVPAIIALFLYAQLPIIRNTSTAISHVEPALREAARGMGMSSWQRLWQVELPLAVPLIMAGVRVAVVINIGIAAIANYIGAGGLGTLIARGISQSDPRQLLAGALLISTMAVAADYLLYGLQQVLTPRGLRGSTRHNQEASA